MTKQNDDWIQTYTGRAFHFLVPDPRDVDICDIANSLGMLCRFTGHTEKFYSVAEHCVVMARMVPADMALYALLHDAAEAYVGDVSRPLKKRLLGFAEIENPIELAIYEHFHVPPPTATEQAAIKRADLRMLRTERDQLMTAPPKAWAEAETVEPYPVTLQCWSPELAPERWRVAVWAATRGWDAEEV